VGILVLNTRRRFKSLQFDSERIEVLKDFIEIFGNFCGHKPSSSYNYL
jgi:hypothetical protein